MSKPAFRALRTHDMGTRITPKRSGLSIMRGYNRPDGSFYMNKHAYSPLGVENISQPKGKVFVARKFIGSGGNF